MDSKMEIFEKIFELTYLSKIYEIKIKLLDNKDENSIILSVWEKDNFPNYIFEEKIKYENFKHLHKLFGPYETINEIYNFLICLEEKSQINIKDINENKIILSIQSKILGFQEPLNAEIQLNKKENNSYNILEILYKKLQKLEKENKKLKANVEFINVFHHLSEIFENLDEIKLIENRLKKESKYENKKMFLKLLFKFSKKEDKVSDFHSKCDNIPSILCVIKTKKNIKFGGYTEISWNNSNKEKYDDNAFCFSLTKYKIYDIIKGSVAIGDYYNHIVFRNNIFWLSTDYNTLYNGSCVKNSKSNFSGEEILYEINNGEEYFEVDKFEVYQVLFE